MDLSDQEMLALAALAYHMAQADGELSAAESTELRDLATEVGQPAAFWKALADAETRFPTPDDALAFAAGVEREDARQFLHTVLSDLAMADELDESEAAFLNQIRTLWGIKTAQ